MRRREFITLLGGAAVAWPLAARAQQPERIRRIGALSGIGVDDPESQKRIAAFVERLQQLGWTDGRNVRIDHRWGGGDPDNIRKQAVELAALQPDRKLACRLPRGKETLHTGSRPSTRARRGSPSRCPFLIGERKWTPRRRTLL